MREIRVLSERYILIDVITASRKCMLGMLMSNSPSKIAIAVDAMAIYSNNHPV